MKKTIGKIIKFGVPFLVLLMMLYIQFFASSGDAEFGSIGHDGGLAILLLGFIILYFILGIIILAIKKKNLFFLSAIFSIAVMFIYYIVIVTIGLFNNSQRSKELDNYRENQLKTYQPIYDSLTIIVEKSDSNYIEIEKRALIYINNIYFNTQSKDKDKKWDNHIKDLEFAVKNKTQNTEVYSTLQTHYFSKYEYEKDIKMLETALKTVNLTEKEKRKFEGDLYNAKMSKKEQIRRAKAEKEWQEQQIKDSKLLVKKLTEKFNKNGYNIEDLIKRGLAYRSLNEPQKALADFNKALELNPDNNEVLSHKANVLEDLKRYSEVIPIYIKLKAKYPERKDYYQKRINKVKNKNKK